MFKTHQDPFSHVVSRGIGSSEDIEIAKKVIRSVDSSARFSNSSTSSEDKIALINNAISALQRGWTPN